jgi:hypothetical protein
MAEVYDEINGKVIESVIGRHYEVQAELSAVTFMHGQIAAETLYAHEYDGHSEIVTESDGFNRYIILDDTRGLLAAKAILSGRGGRAQPVPVFDSMLQPRNGSGRAIRRRLPDRRMRPSRGRP